MKEGNEIEVVLDGRRLILTAAGGRQAGPEAETTASRVAEAGLDYVIARAASAHKLHNGQPLSEVWADRIQALAVLKRLRAEMPAMDAAELLTASRRELDERACRPQGGPGPGPEGPPGGGPAPAPEGPSVRRAAGSPGQRAVRRAGGWPGS